MYKDDDIDEQKRDFLVQALTAGAFVASGSMGVLMPEEAEAGIFGKVPRKLGTGKSIYDLKGQVSVNGQDANESTLIKPNDVVETGEKSKVIFAVGKDAYILRSNSHLQIAGNSTNFLTSGLRLLSGKLLSVFGKRSKRERLSLGTSTATIGIRGTGVYMEADPEETYVCTCYGVTDLSSAKDPSSKERITSLHHDAPRYILAKGAEGKRIRNAPVKNHTDLELMLIEELVGRVPPFAVSDLDYSGPRRGY